MTRVLTVLSVLLACAGPALAQGAPPSAKADLLKTDREWAQTVTSKDVERIVSYWTDDAVVYPPHEAPVAGKAAIRAFVGDALKAPGFSITWTPREAIVSASGELGYTTGTNTITAPDAQGKPATLRGRYVTVWRKEAGRWRCVVDFWNEAPAPSAAAPAQK